MLVKDYIWYRTHSVSFKMNDSGVNDKWTAADICGGATNVVIMPLLGNSLLLEIHLIITLYGEVKAEA